MKPRELPALTLLQMLSSLEVRIKLLFLSLSLSLVSSLLPNSHVFLLRLYRFYTSARFGHTSSLYHFGEGASEDMEVGEGPGGGGGGVKRLQ